VDRKPLPYQLEIHAPDNIHLSDLNLTFGVVFKAFSFRGITIDIHLNEKLVKGVMVSIVKDHGAVENCTTKAGCSKACACITKSDSMI
jgi:hypothetical protein